MPSVVVLGSHPESYPCLRYMLDSVPELKVVGIIPHQTQPSVRPDQDVRVLAQERSVPVLGLDALGGLEVDLGISLLFDRVLPASVIERPPLGFVNIHLGPLPRFRGANSVMHAIRLARRDDHWRFGVTMHYMAPKVDTGPIIDLLEFPIHEDDTAFMLHGRACQHVFPLFQRNIHRLAKSTERLPSRPQEGLSYFFRKGEVDHEIDLTAPPDEIYDRIRSLTFPGKDRPYAVIGGRKIYLALDPSGR